jgi:purine-nucleoside phosphorylase
MRDAVGEDPFDLALVLGSGWSEALAGVRCVAEFPYRNWPCFPAGQIAGHSGQLRVLDWHGRRLLAFAGRWHCYQNLSAYQTTLPVRLAAVLGVPRMVLTCATGGINPAYRPGDFMLVADHLNLLGDNPLKGLPAAFIDLGELYCAEVFHALVPVARAHAATLHRGVLAAMPGPSYETPAEIAMLERLGADAVGMSTVPEAIMAGYLGMPVVALALIANPAAGRAPGPIRHADVLHSGTRCSGVARALLETLIVQWP